MCSSYSECAPRVLHYPLITRYFVLQSLLSHTAPISLVYFKIWSYLTVCLALPSIIIASALQRFRVRLQV